MRTVVVLSPLRRDAAGLKGIRTGRPIRKDSEFWASDERILKHVRKCVCKCTELHAATGRDEPSKCAQVWPYALCNGIAKGCVEVLSDKHGGPRHALVLQEAPYCFDVAVGTLTKSSWDYFPSVSSNDNYTTVLQKWVSIFTEKTFNLQKEQPPIKCPATPTPSVKDIEKKLKVAFYKLSP